MRPGAVDTADRPVVLIWELTQACDLACDHCRADAQPHRHPLELSTEEGRQLLADASEFGERQLVVLSGGDPLLREDVEELVEYGTELGLRMTMTPSGTRSLTAERIGGLADAGLRRMALSLDGASAEAHDDFRGEDGTFEETLRAAVTAREAGIPIQVNTTVCRDTVGELPAIRELIADLEVAMWSVFFLVPVGRGQLLEPITPQRSDAVMRWLWSVSREESFAVKTTEAPHYRRVALQSERERRRAPDDGPASGGNPGGRERESRGRDGTTAGKSDDGENRPPVPGRRRGVIAGDGFAFVSHTGEVFPSGFLPLSAGRVRERPITEIYRESELFEDLRDRDNLCGKCGACPYRTVCGGSRSRAFAATGDPFESDPLCPYVPPGYDGPLPVESRRTAPDGGVTSDGTTTTDETARES